MKEDFRILIGYLKEFWKKKRFIFSVMVVFFVIGAVNAFFSHKQFTARTSFVAQVSGGEKLGSGLKNIAELIGVNFNDNSETKDLPIYLYPKIIRSVDYQRALLKTPINVKGRDTAVTLEYFYNNIRRPDLATTLKKYTIGLPSLILRQFKSESAEVVRYDSVNYITKREMQLFAMLSENVIFTLDETDGTIFLSSTMSERIASAQVAEQAKKLLQEKIIEYRIAKATKEYNFILDQYEKKKEEFNSAQASYANYMDRNMFNSTQASQIRKQRLEMDYNLSSMVFSELETQRIRQGIKVQEDTPSFMTIQPATVPLEPNNANAILIIFKFLFLGFIVAALLYVVMMVRDSLREIWKTV